MHTDAKLSSVSSATRIEGSCCGHGDRASADSAKPSAAPERSAREKRAETKREAVPGKSKGCCCSG